MNGTDEMTPKAVVWFFTSMQIALAGHSYLYRYPMAHLTKQLVYNIEDSNIALLGSDVSVPSIPDAIIEPCRDFVARETRPRRSWGRRNRLV